MKIAIEIIQIPEYSIPEGIEQQLLKLLDQVFPDGLFRDRIYFKQRPHFRFLAMEGETVVGNLGIDCRVINVGGTVLTVFGGIDLFVHPDRRGAGLAFQLLEAAESLACASSQDFFIVMAELHSFYEQHGFHRVQPANAKWFAIEDRKSHSLTEQDLSDCFMVKQLGATGWPEGEIDLLGYLF